MLRPLGPDGDGRYTPGTFDYRSDTTAAAAPQPAMPGAVLLFDGVFLLRPELRGFWDVSIYLHVDPEVTLDIGSRTLPTVVRQRVHAQLCPAVWGAELRFRFPL